MSRQRPPVAIRALPFLVEKEFKQLLRNSLLPRMVVIFPTLMVLVFPWAVSFEVADIRLDIVDHAHDSYSRRLTQKVVSSGKFVSHAYPHGFREAMDNMEQNRADMILEIPPHFEYTLVREHRASLGIVANSVNGNTGLLGSNYMSAIIADFSSEIAQELIGTLPRDRQMILSGAPRIQVEPRYLFNPHLDYKRFMVPAFIVLALTLLCGILPSLNIVMEKENGTIKQINVTPVNKLVFILAKLIPYWAIGILVMFISVTVSYFVYGLWPAAGLHSVLLVALTYIFSISGMGIVISNYSETMQQASFIVMFFILILVLLGGMFTPISSMPLWAQGIAYANPLTYIIRSLRLLYLNGATLRDVLPDLLRLLPFVVVLNGWAIVSYRKRG